MQATVPSLEDIRPNLFTPIRLGAHQLPNRIVMAPLTRNRAGKEGVPQAMNIEYYRQRAGAGLIVTEGSQISPQGQGYPGTPGIHSPEQVAGWRRVTDAVHDQGGRIFLQLWHVGRVSHPSLQPDGALPVAPSAIPAEGEGMTLEGPKPFVTPRALELDEIPGLIGQYSKAAENARRAGFDGVEVHAANGYLLDQFLRDGSNQRTDKYGGSVENRLRLLLEITDAVSRVWDAERVGVRLSPLNSFNTMTDSSPQTTFVTAAESLNHFGLAYLHVVEPDFTGQVTGFDYLRLRNSFLGPYIANGGYDKERADRALESGAADLVSFGKAFIANPDLTDRFATNGTLNEPDPSTFYGGDERGYIDYPALP